MASNAQKELKKELDYSAFLKSIEPYSSVGITAPAGADGDSVGTQSSLYDMIKGQFPQKTVRIINEEPCPVRYRFMELSPQFEVSEDILKADPKTWPEVMICVDGGATRIGEDTTKLWNAAKIRGQVDHHAIGTEVPYQFRLYDPEAAATTEIIFKMYKALGVKMTPRVAQAIYVGLIFDTGMFKHSNTRPETMRIGAELLEVGFDHTTTAEKGMLIRSASALQMLKSVLNSMATDSNGRYVWGVLDYQSFIQSKGDSDDREGIIDALFLVRDCEIAAFYFEKKPGDWKISFRARGQWNVAALAQSLSSHGGGHIKAAGCSLSGNREQILQRCHEAVKTLLRT